MSLVPLLVLVVNIAFPLWLWTRSGPAHPQLDSAVWEKNAARLVQSAGGFSPCSIADVIDVLRQVCAVSQQRLTEKSLTVERAAREVVFFCEFKPDSVSIGWYAESSPDADLACGAVKGDALALKPKFVFVPSGRMRAIEFTGHDGQQQVIPYRNCRVKANRLKALPSFPADEESFLHGLDRTVGDPADSVAANRLCFIFDSSPLWNPAREKYTHSPARAK